MRRIDCGIAGAAPGDAAPAWQDLGLDPLWLRVLAVLAPGTAPRPVQVETLQRLRFLEGRRNLVVSAPTNSGKSLVGLLAVLDAVRRGKRAVLLEPLRTVAREKWDELQAAQARLEVALGRRLRVLISTGDYRLDNESFTSPPPDRGELVIATPERLDAVLRNPARDPWFAGLGTVVVDEAHLIGSAGRGATLEYLITSLLCLPAPPRLVLLSATLGNLDRMTDWLQPCDAALSTVRVPPLRREVWELGDDSADETIARFATEALQEKDAQVLVFVYQTRSAEALAERLRGRLGDSAGPAGPMAYHGQMPQARREEVRRAFQAGNCRLVVTTTALALGVNLPATHVCVRDLVFPGVGMLSVADLLQMMGRAGRGDRPGHAVVLVRTTDGISADDLAHAIRQERIPELRSTLEPSNRSFRSRAAEEPGADCAPAVLARLARHSEEGLSLQEVRDFFARSLGGRGIAGQVRAALDWLTDPRRLLAFEDESQRFRPTVLGLRAARAVLPLAVAAGFARLLRDLLTLDDSDEVLQGWQPLDHLLVLELTHPHAGLGTRFSERLAGRLDSWLEAEPARAPRFYRGWIAGPAGQSKAHQVLGSLGVRASERDNALAARKTAYLALLRCVLLFERGQGRSEPAIEKEWGSTGLSGVEERWRDDHLWLLSGLRDMLEVRCFYYHLKEGCHAGPERVRRVDRALRRMRKQTYELQEQLKYCSPLGSVLSGLRQAAGKSGGRTVGIDTIRRLEAAGIRDVEALARCTVADLVRLGVRQPWAGQLAVFVQRSAENPPPPDGGGSPNRAPLPKGSPT